MLTIKNTGFSKRKSKIKNLLIPGGRTEESLLSRGLTLILPKHIGTCEYGIVPNLLSKAE